MRFRRAGISLLVGLMLVMSALAAEHGSPRFCAITVRPGIIDTPMQAELRSQPPERYPNVELFKGFHAGGQLVPPDVVARKIVERLVLAPVEQGRTYTYLGVWERARARRSLFSKLRKRIRCRASSALRQRGGR